MLKKKRDEEEANKEKSQDTISPLIHWGNDSKDGSLTSEGVIVEWLTDESNAEKYFGGNHGPNSLVNGTRKDTYHLFLSNKIIKFVTNNFYLGQF